MCWHLRGLTIRCWLGTSASTWCSALARAPAIPSPSSLGSATPAAPPPAGEWHPGAGARPPLRGSSRRRCGSWPSRAARPEAGRFARRGKAKDIRRPRRVPFFGAQVNSVRPRSIQGMKSPLRKPSARHAAAGSVAERQNSTTRRTVAISGVRAISAPFRRFALPDCAELPREIRVHDARFPRIERLFRVGCDQRLTHGSG